MTTPLLYEAKIVDVRGSVTYVPVQAHSAEAAKQLAKRHTTNWSQVHGVRLVGR